MNLSTEMDFLGIKFAPLKIPFERRLQTIAAGAWFMSVVCSGLLGWITTAYLILCTRFYLLTIIYLIWIIYDRDIGNRGGRKVDWIRNWTWWKYFYSYFPLSLVKTADLPSDRNYLFAVYPHGMLCSGVFGNFATGASKFNELFPGLRPYILTLNSHFRMPFSRELTLGLGSCSASRESIMYLLEEDKKLGKVLTLMVGGARESLNCRPGTYNIILKNRKGFVKIALETGTSLVPVFSFGETDLYDQMDNPPGSWLYRFQNYTRQIIGIAPCIPIGRGIFQYSFGLVPRRHPVTTVVGKPIHVKKIENPTAEQINELHERYTAELIELFEEYKHKYISFPEKTHLIIE